jgi:uncharacterized protein (TIGR03437 family)
MRIRTVRTLQALAAGAIPITLLAFSTGPPIMRTGAAVDGGLACTQCHISFALNDDTGGSVVIRANPYTPGVKQLIEVQVNHPTAMRFGFQLTARAVSDETQQAGTFTVDDNIRVRCAPTGDAPCNGALEFAEHKQPTTNAGNPGPRTFIIEWTPPATDVGPVVMYAAGNAANNNNAPTGDHIYTTSTMIAAADSNQGRCLNMVSSAPSIAPNGWISITGSKLATASRTWASSDIAGGKLPTSLNGTSVKINGKDAVVYSISPTQVGALAPLDDTTGEVTVQVATNGTETASVTALLQPFSPAFFTSQDNSIVAEHADFTLVGPASPAKPGETIVLYGAGFGATDPAVPGGQSLAASTPLANPVKVRIGGVDVQPYFAGLSATGVYQINVTLPDTTADGAIPVVATIGGVSTPGTATIPVQK